MTDGPGEPAVALLAAVIDGRPYGFLADRVREIVRMAALRPVGHGGPGLLGLLDLHGELLPVLALEALLGAPPRRIVAADFIVVLASAEGGVAVAVDGVDEVYDAGPLQAPPLGLLGRELLAGVARHGTGLLPVLDVARLAAAAKVAP